MRRSVDSRAGAVWPALLLAPSTLLGVVSIGYALVWPACLARSLAGLHLFMAGSLLAVLAMTAFAWRAWRSLQPPRAADEPGDDDAGAAARAGFVAAVAIGMGALSAMSLVGIWIPLWMLPPCL